MEERLAEPGVFRVIHRTQRARLELQEIADSKLAELVDALLFGPFLCLFNALFYNFDANAVATVLRSRLVKHTSITTAEVPEAVLFCQPCSSKHSRNPSRGAGHVWRDRSRRLGNFLAAEVVLLQQSSLLGAVRVHYNMSNMFEVPRGDVDASQDFL